jgi:hypothetical protein
MPEKPIIVSVQPAQQMQATHGFATAAQVRNAAPTEIHIEAADIEYYKNDMMREFEERSKLYEDPKKQEQKGSSVRGRAWPRARWGGVWGTGQTGQRQTNDVVNDIANEIIVGSQTVHDSTVQSTIRNIYKNEVEAKSNDSLELDKSVQRDIMNFMRQSDLPYDQYDKVETALLEIQKRNAPIHNLDGEKEGSLVARIWAGANENVKRQLLNELVDANKDYDGGGIYCPTGVVTRVLQATQIENPEAMPRTRDNLRQEMMNTAARVRNELEQTEEFKAMGDTKQSETLKSRLMETYQKDYDGIVSKDIIEAETKEWIDAV